MSNYGYVLCTQNYHHVLLSALQLNNRPEKIYS